jgi:hypothetical protein
LLSKKTPGKTKGMNKEQLFESIYVEERDRFRSKRRSDPLFSPAYKLKRLIDARGYYVDVGVHKGTPTVHCTTGSVSLGGASKQDRDHTFLSFTYYEDDAGGTIIDVDHLCIDHTWSDEEIEWFFIDSILETFENVSKIVVREDYRDKDNKVFWREAEKRYPELFE